MSCDGRLLATIILSLATPTLALAQVDVLPPAAARNSSAPTERAVLAPADYDRIATLGGSELSPDGQWIAYHYRRGSGGGELRYRRVSAGDEQVVSMGTAPEFSDDSRWLFHTILADSTPTWLRMAATATGPGAARGVPAAATEAGRNSVGIVDLRTGTTTVLKDIQSFSVSSNGRHVALRRYQSTGRQGRASDLVVRDLARGTELTFGNIAEYGWSDDGALLAMTVDVGGRTGNSVQFLAVGSGVLTSLDAGDTPYMHLRWRERSRDLVVMRGRADSAYTDTSYTVLAWRDIGTPRVRSFSYDFSVDSAVPTTLRVAAYREPQWSSDGRTIFLGFAPREPKPSPGRRVASAPGQGPARVEVWHWKDTRLYHQQNRQSQADRQRTLLASWQLDGNRVVRLTDDFEERIQLSDDGSTAIVHDDTPYLAEALSGRAFRDVYTVDVRNGARTKVLTRSALGASMSPGGRYLLHTDGGQWWSYDRTSGKRANLTGATGSVFVDMEDDHPTPERRPYGVAGWTEGDQAVILQDRYDLWQVNPDGTKPVRLTRGREDSTVYRIVRTDSRARIQGRSGQRGGGAGEAVDPRKPLWLSATGDYTRKSGFARLDPGRPAQRLLWLDRGVSRLTRARDADVFSYVVESYEQAPELHLARGATTAGFEGAQQLSRMNDFLREYAWGRQELLSYVTPQGDSLQMMLTYPANYEPGKRYPMVVYYYEKLSQGYQQFIVPTQRATYNTTVFSQNGYFVLRPDVRFRARDPGISGLHCVKAAVKTVLEMGMVDPARVGNMGHSWGGYQSAFYAVHAPGLFAATIAGAPLTNLISMYGYTSYNSGLPETGHFETGQERMEVPLWDDPQAYIRNSTVFAVDSLRTPLLLQGGDADGNVNYWQSMELYNFGRRLGKNVVFLLYNDENHGVARPESQRDYQQRQLEWFGHYLKGEPAARWITEGEGYQARQKMLRDAAAASASPGRDSTARPPQ